MTTFYKKTISKAGRVKYIPVSEYDNETSYALPKGVHMISVQPGMKSTIYNINPDSVRLLAAATLVREPMIKVLLDASEMRPKDQPITQEQQDAWEHFRQLMGGGLSMVQGASIHDIYQKFIDELIQNVDECFEYPTVKKAWDNFITMYQLSANTKEL